MSLALPWRAARENVPLENVEPFEQSSLALRHVTARLAGASRCGVLDLGSPTSSNIELYARHRARITFADLYRFYAPTRSAVSSPKRFAAALPGISTQLDVVLAWDLFDYLSLEEIGWLGEWLASHCARGALLFALVSCPGLVSSEPSFYTIADDETLRVEQNGARERRSPAHTEHALLRALRGQSVRNRFQLRRSTVEYLFGSD